jgi:hypothetical protein
MTGLLKYPIPNNATIKVSKVEEWPCDSYPEGVGAVGQHKPPNEPSSKPLRMELSKNGKRYRGAP